MDRIKHLNPLSLLKKLLYNKTFGVIISDGEGNIVYANEKILDICGYSSEELSGAGVSKIFFPCDDLTDAESIKSVYGESELDADLEKFIIKKDGSRSWIRYSGIINEDAGVFSVIGIVRSIDDMKNIEKNFYESQERTKQMLKLIPSGILAVDNDRKITIFNKMAEEITGYKSKDVVGRGREILSSASFTEEAFSGAISKPVFNRECNIRTSGGAVRLISKNEDLLYDETGFVVGAIESFEDITEKKSIENEIRKLTIAMEQSYNVIVITDTFGFVTYVNDAFEVITGYARSEVIGRKLNLIKSGVHPASFYKELWDTISSGKVWQGEIENQKKDGSLYWERAVITPVKNEKGEIVNYIGVKEDISKQKHLEEFKSDIEKIIRHDLKAPLTAIMGFPEVMMDDANLDNEQREMLKIIYEKSNEMLNQINSSMSLYRIEEGRFELTAVRLDVYKILKKIEYDMGLYSKNFSVSLKFNFAGRGPSAGSEPLFIMGDETLFYSILSNLIKNAIEASREGGEVSVDIKSGGPVFISVHNQGVIPEAVRKNFFTKYATHGKKFGTGLGAYGAKLMAEAMGAAISFATDETSGTTIVLKFEKD